MRLLKRKPYVDPLKGIYKDMPRLQHKDGADLAKDVQLAGWCSPMAQDGSRGGLPARETDTGVPLSRQAATCSPWATPVASEARQGYQNRHNGKKGSQESLTTEVVNAFGIDPESSDAGTGNRGGFRLNVHFSRWLQGFPEEWLSSKVLETLSSPRLPRSSSGPPSTLRNEIYE